MNTSKQFDLLTGVVRYKLSEELDNVMFYLVMFCLFFICSFHLSHYHVPSVLSEFE